MGSVRIDDAESLRFIFIRLRKILLTDIHLVVRGKKMPKSVMRALHFLTFVNTVAEPQDCRLFFYDELAAEVEPNTVGRHQIYAFW